MRHDKVGAFVFASVALLPVLGAARQAVAQDAKAPYPAMASIDEYLMPDRGAEIALARSAGLEVRPTGSASGGWSILSRTELKNPLASGIRYGKLPSEGRTVIPASPLVAGAEYEVVVRRWRFDAIPGEPSPALLAAGSARFVAR